MLRAGVQSSTIKEIGHDPRTLTLEIEFHNGSVYQYFDVPQVVYEELMRAPSHGEYLSRQIKEHYRYAKV